MEKGVMKRKKCLQTGLFLAFLAAGTMMAACAVPERFFVETTGENSSEYSKEIIEDNSQVSGEPTGKENSEGSKGTMGENASEEPIGKENSEASSGTMEENASEEPTGGTAAEYQENIADGEKQPENPSGQEAAAGKADWKISHEKVKGIYVTGPMAGSSGMDSLITLVDETELNAMVIDVKNDDGNITWKLETGSPAEIGACVSYISDMQGLMAKLKEHHIYTIARIVCFKDPYLAAAKPELALKKPDGTLVTDANGLAFVNPYREETWDYLVEVASAASELGFDEIQFDYVRFPIGTDADAADYGVDLQTYTKEQAITGFLSYVAEQFEEKGIVFGADVFGTIIGSETDVERVGQNYKAIGGIVDVLSPMVYPSHYANGVFGLEVPDARPYETVLRAMQDSDRELQEVEEENRAVVRPWLQSFTASWVPGHITYEGEEIRQQIQAVYDAGYEEWILWNASNRYSADGLGEVTNEKK